MNIKKNNIKKLSKQLQVEQKYKFIIKKLPNGLITLTKSTYIPQDIIIKINNKDINIQAQQDKIHTIIVDVDYTQNLIENKNKKKQQSNKPKSARFMNLSKKII